MYINETLILVLIVFFIEVRENVTIGGQSERTAEEESGSDITESKVTGQAIVE